MEKEIIVLLVLKPSAFTIRSHYALCHRSLALLSSSITRALGGPRSLDHPSSHSQHCSMGEF